MIRKLKSCRRLSSRGKDRETGGRRDLGTFEPRRLRAGLTDEVRP
jgi:hypothetical protein